MNDNHITEIIPDDMPDWMRKAFDDGQFFNVSREKVESLLLKNAVLSDQINTLELAMKEIYNTLLDASWEDAPFKFRLVRDIIFETLEKGDIP